MTDSYGISFLHKDKSARQQFCKTKYNFVCKCEACLQDYPMMRRTGGDSSSEDDMAMHNRTASVLSVLLSGDTSTAINMTKEMYKDLAAANIPDENQNVQKLRIILGTCLRIQYAL